MQIVYGNFKKVRETEKAYQLEYGLDSRDILTKMFQPKEKSGLGYGNKENEKFWIPKSTVKELSDTYVVAKWWKFRTGGMDDSEGWPGIPVRIIHNGSLGIEELKKIKENEDELDVRLFKRALKENFETLYNEDKIEIVVPEEVWKEELKNI